MKEDWKKRFVALLDEMEDAQCRGVIPIMVAEGLRECKAYERDDIHGNIVYWTMKNLMK